MICSPRIVGSPMVIDGKVYLGDEDGDVTILNADKTLKVITENNMGSSVYSTPVPAHGTLFIVNATSSSRLPRVQLEAKQRPACPQRRCRCACNRHGRAVPRAVVGAGAGPCAAAISRPRPRCTEPRR